jgi:hypothetical protein
VGDIVRLCISDLDADALFYLGNESDALEMIAARRRELDDEAQTQALWRRSEACLSASADELDEFVRVQRSVRAWAQLETLGGGGQRRLLSARGHFWLLCADRTLLDEAHFEDAELLAFGHQDEPLIDLVAGQVLVAPGALAAAGLMLLDDDEGLTIQSYDPTGQLLREERIALSQLPPPVARSANA